MSKRILIPLIIVVAIVAAVCAGISLSGIADPDENNKPVEPINPPVEPTTNPTPEKPEEEVPMVSWTMYYITEPDEPEPNEPEFNEPEPPVEVCQHVTLRDAGHLSGTNTHTEICEACGEFSRNVPYGYQNISNGEGTRTHIQNCTAPGCNHVYNSALDCDFSKYVGDGTIHKHACIYCGQEESCTIEYDSFTEEGIHKHKEICTVCGYSGEPEICSITHIDTDTPHKDACSKCDYGELCDTEYTTDANEKEHWGSCKKCGLQVGQKEKCDLSTGYQHENENPESHYIECPTCGHKYEEIPSYDVKVDGGEITYTCKKDNFVHHEYAVCSSKDDVTAAITAGENKYIISGGKWNLGMTTGLNFQNVVNPVVTIKGGSFENWLRIDSAEVFIEDGIFDISVIWGDSTTITITGGFFTKEDTLTVAGDGTGCNLKIMGGTFTATALNSITPYISAGYSAKENADGTYTVSKD